MLLDSIKLRSMYVTLQEQIFKLIPEKWNKIYLYAALTKKINNIETGEMFFYYFPKGILKKNPVNVYEIPTKFNIDEKSYLNAVENLYDDIKKIRNEFAKQNQNLYWDNVNIIIENNKFTIKYNFEKSIISSKYTSEDRHLIWKYEYLDMPIEILSRKDRKMIEEYYEDIDKKNIYKEEYTESMYKNAHNNIEYDVQDLNKIDIVENVKDKKDEDESNVSQILKLN